MKDYLEFLWNGIILNSRFWIFWFICIGWTGLIIPLYPIVRYFERKHYED